MAIKSFDKFINENLSESYLSEAEGKTPFSRWLKGISDRAKEIGDGDSYYSRYYGGANDITKSSRVSASLIPGAVRLIAGAGAALTDFFFGGKNKDHDMSGLSKKEVKSKKKEMVDYWESKNISNKKVSREDAEKFYKSGVLRGKKYFGSNFDPTNPKNKEEEIYSDYLNDVMERYYKNLTI